MVFEVIVTFKDSDEPIKKTFALIETIRAYFDGFLCNRKMELITIKKGGGP